jgi:hypothetical protein
MRKYRTEVALHVSTKGVTLLRPGELYRDDMVHPEPDSLAHSHIYIVGERPRIRLVDGGPRDETGFPFKVSVARRDDSEIREFHIPNQPSFDGELSAVEPMESGVYFRFAKRDGERSGNFALEYLLSARVQAIPELAELNVLYVGQAYGKAGERNAIKRLRRHETLQKILAHHAEQRPWMEVALLVVEFDEPEFMYTIEGDATPSVDGDEDTAHMVDIFDNQPPEKVVIDIVEASIIRYFRPPYNEKFATAYPKRQHRHLAEMYLRDYAAIIVVLSTEDTGIATGSATVRASLNHLARFDLHGDTERQSFFVLHSKGKRIDMRDAFARNGRGPSEE